MKEKCKTLSKTHFYNTLSRTCGKIYIKSEEEGEYCNKRIIAGDTPYTKPSNHRLRNEELSFKRAERQTKIAFAQR